MPRPLGNDPLFYVKCRDCPYARDVGTASVSAGEIAIRHRRLHELHTVVVYKEYKRFTPDLLMLPITGDTIPF